MICPKCTYQWCWNCGMEISDPRHTSFTCDYGMSIFDLYWYIIVTLIFLPILFPFMTLLLVVYGIDISADFDENENVFN